MLLVGFKCDVRVVVSFPALPLGGGEFLWNFFVFAFCAFLGVFEAVAISVGLNDVDAVGDAVKQRAGHLHRVHIPLPRRGIGAAHAGLGFSDDSTRCPIGALYPRPPDQEATIPSGLDSPYYNTCRAPHGIAPLWQRSGTASASEAAEGHAVARRARGRALVAGAGIHRFLRDG